MPHDLPPLLARLDRRAGRLGVLSHSFSRARFALALIGFGGAFALGSSTSAGRGWLAALVVAVAFALLARRHDRVERARTRLARWRRVKGLHLDRLALRWEALPPPPAPAPADHPFGADLDIAGPRSVGHLLDTTATVGGHERLRDWLLEPSPDAESVRQRQRRVRALVAHRRFRDRLTLLGLEAADGADRWDDAPVRAWLRGEPLGVAFRRLALFLSSVAAVTAVLVAVDVLGGPVLWPYTFLVYAAVYLMGMGRAKGVFDRAYDLQRAVARAEPLLRFLEDARLRDADALAPVWASFHGDERPSVQYRGLRRVTSAAAISHNEVGRIVLNAVLPYDLLLALRLDRLRVRLQAILPQWLDALFETEALAALAAYADFRPSTSVFPALADAGTTPLFDAADLTHPLLPIDAAVANDAALAPGEVMLLTGSNMAGKSTFLRAVGVATVMAWAGGAVAAARLSVAPLRPFASMRVGDVLQEGYSTFYAEVRRLRLLLDGVRDAGGAPTLVLIDEMYRGTNNRERLAGARAIVRTLAGARAASLVATHDLALAEMEAEVPLVRNAHFREHVEDGRLLFDYRLRDGPCPTTNALRIMEAAGLPVEEPSA